MWRSLAHRYKGYWFKFRGEKLKTITGTIMIHDCIYQFLRLFYHSRFKPQQLEMTLSQLLAPALDLVLVIPLILRLFKDFSRLSNKTKTRNQFKPEINQKLIIKIYRNKSWKSHRKCLFFSHIYLSSIACLSECDGKTRLAILYQAKNYREILDTEMKARDPLYWH